MRVFISHRTGSDAAVAHRLSADLRDRGIATWIAPEDVDPGTTWPRAIEAGLQACSHVVLLLSESTLGSPAVQQEMQMAEMLQLEGSLVLLPLLLEPVGLPPWLAVLQYVDFTSYESGLPALLASLERSATAGTAPLRRAAEDAGGRAAARHRVRRGDRLDLVAAQQLGAAERWREIAAGSAVLDPLRLRPGSVLTLPSAPDVGKGT